ncbi:MAG: 4,5-DOPA dioxygenase extradiol [Chloroflexi bacterium]|uniref:4,5-DOPA dioxygenase extradiol n=1 Tax=Candidatus Chlorohelix allophototropha TaxID=3003348 RepID=A0A8T7M316_9CHLR|nr:4,5-DOPA dioxygenase extradiol [Chloroflexota bacterium]WJW67691.1 4,5-DOPA dioxygenase extradiol [Chloroflexota bacterium L227-S17]
MSNNLTGENLFSFSDQKLPALFIGHGSPMNAIEDNEFSRSWEELGKTLPRPHAILCISAHWETRGTQVTAMTQPETIHDFGGFPQELFEYQYPAPGSPELAKLVQEIVQLTKVEPDLSWGLDHGTWSILTKIYPEADIPIVQLSLDRTKEPAYHYALGKELRALRNRGVMIIGSGNIVHNLRFLSFQITAYDWAIEFDTLIKQLIEKGDHESIVNFRNLGKAAQLSIPTSEHFLPLLYILALQEETDSLRFFAEQFSMGSLSMSSVCLEA